MYRSVLILSTEGRDTRFISIHRHITRFFARKKSPQRAVITPLTPALYDGSLYFCLTPVTEPEWISRIYYVFSSRHGGTSQKTNSFWSQYIKLDSQVTVMNNATRWPTVLFVRTSSEYWPSYCISFIISGMAHVCGSVHLSKDSRLKNCLCYRDECHFDSLNRQHKDTNKPNKL
jgi:hypothetical protein